MKKTMLSAVVSLLAAGVLMGGCMADVGGEGESDGVAAERPNGGGGEEIGEAGTEEADELAVRDAPTELGLGAEGPEIVAAHAYLQRYGYFPNPELAARYPGWVPVVDVAPEDPEFFDTTLEEALAMFQQTHGLPVTGLLDGPTRALMEKPRCSFPDAYALPHSASSGDARLNPSVSHGATAIDHGAEGPGPVPYTTLTYSWPYSDLKYSFGAATGDIDVAFQRQAVVAAMNTWSAVAPIAWAERANPDVLVSFVAAAHGDGNDFQPNTYAHAFSPSCSQAYGSFDCTGLQGDIHFNDETFAWGTGNGGSVQDIQTIALHELGHSLGLGHSDDANAVMYASSPLGAIRRSLAADDINGIRAIYPNFRDLRIFEPTWYLWLNSDVANAFAWNTNSGSFHWISNGRAEGRMASPGFDVRYYLQNNPDLVQAFGANNYIAALWHWREYGLTEGRRGSPAFDPRDYLNRHADVRNAFGATNYGAALQHWLANGIAEGRRASSSFDPVYYLQANPDVANAYGATNYAGGLQHWLVAGINEGRTAVP